MKALKHKIVKYLKKTEVIWGLIVLFWFAIGTYAFTWPPAWCTPGNCDLPLTQDLTNQRVGIATEDPQMTLDVNGGMRIGQLTTWDINAITCDANKLGTLLFDTDENIVKVCKSSGWDDLSNYTYDWYESGFGTCSKTCGGGTQTQTVYCEQTPGGAIVDDSLCLGPKPDTSQSCNTQACPDCRFDYIPQVVANYFWWQGGGIYWNGGWACSGFSPDPDGSINCDGYTYTRGEYQFTRSGIGDYYEVCRVPN